MRRAFLGGGALTAAVLISVFSLPSSARAAELRRVIAPGVELHAFTRFDANGPQEVRVIRFAPGAAGIHLRPIAAADLGSRRLKVSDLVLRSGALAAVNGNFFTPSGNVRGILATAGVLRSEPEAPINGALAPRAAWRVDDTNRLEFGRPSSELHLHKGDRTWGLNGIDRITGYLNNPDEAVVETPRFGSATSTPAGGVDVVLSGTGELHAGRPAPANVTEVRSGPGPIPPGGAVISAVGANAADLAGSGLAPGSAVEVHAHVDDPAFASTPWAGGGGPWLLHDGGVIPRQAMLGEGFTPKHLDDLAPRTAIGRAADGTIVLVTIDGRQPGRSVGATITQLAATMAEQGARDAIALDGGGSTAMAVDGVPVNVPSGEDANGRPGVETAVADAVGVFVDFTPTDTRRLAGVDRVATSVEVARQFASASTVVLATSAGFADALVGGPLAASTSSPVLLTAPDSLDPRVSDEIRRLGATSVVLLGGSAALSQVVEDAVRATGLAVERIAGASRYETAAGVAGALGPSPTVLVASGEAFPDALSAGALGLPVLLTTRDVLPDATAVAIGASTPIVVGGPVAVAPQVLPAAARIAGTDRYDTSARVADWGLANGRYNDARLVTARGDRFPDALVGGALRQPLLLVGRYALDDTPATRDWIARHGGPAQEAVLLGGRQALSTMTQIQVEAAVAP